MQINNIITTKEKRRILRKNMTQMERFLWSHLKQDKLGVRFRRQFSIGQYIADFYCPEYKLVIEVDGDTHQGLQAKEYDAVRDLFMNSLNIKVIRFTNEDVKNNIENVTNKIRRHLG
jgi:very-short-patch-repair endonuclease